MDGVDAVVSIACSVGPQYVVARYPYLRVFPASTPPASAGPWSMASGKILPGLRQLYHWEFGGLCPSPAVPSNS